ncbi:MAG: hypothetical protein ACYC4L_19400 [Chloroflexota bacterium]
MAEKNPGPEQPAMDPFETWRKMYDATEQAWTNALKEMTTTPSYVEAQGKMLEVFLAYQKLIRDAMSTQLTSFNLPSRDDVSRLGELSVGVEEKVDQLVDRIGQVEEPMRAVEQSLKQLSKKMAQPDEAMDEMRQQVGRVAGIEKSVNKLSDRLEKIESALAGLGEQLSRLESQNNKPAAEGEAAAERPKRQAEKGGR